jgi:hypothetical protein
MTTTATPRLSAQALSKLFEAHGVQVKLCYSLRYDDPHHELEKAKLVELRFEGGNNPGTYVKLTESGKDLAASLVEARWLTRRYTEMVERAAV